MSLPTPNVEFNGDINIINLPFDSWQVDKEVYINRRWADDQRPDLVMLKPRGWEEKWMQQGNNFISHVSTSIQETKLHHTNGIDFHTGNTRDQGSGNEKECFLLITRYFRPSFVFLFFVSVYVFVSVFWQLAISWFFFFLCPCVHASVLLKQDAGNTLVICVFRK